MFKYGNYAVSRLSTDLAAAGSSLSFVDSSNFPTTGTFAAVIWRTGFNSPSDDSQREIVHVRWDGTSWTLLRGREGTTARFWPGNSNVANIITADFLEGIQVFDASLYDNLQCAIDAAYTAHLALYTDSSNVLNPTVWVYCSPNTIYDITTPILLRNYVMVQGNHSIIRPSSAATAAVSHSAATKIHKCGMVDMHIQLTTASQTGIYIDGTSGDAYEMEFRNITIQHVESTPTILTGTIGIYLRTAYDNLFDNCIINLCERAVVLARGANNNLFSNCKFRGARIPDSETVSSNLHLIDIQGGIGSEFHNCRLEGNYRLIQVNGYDIYDDGIYDSTLRMGGYISDSTKTFTSAYLNKFMINRKNGSMAKIGTVVDANTLKSNMSNIVTAPATPTSDLAAGAGLSTGAYRWAVSYYSSTSGYESAMSAYTAETTGGATHQVTVHFVASTETTSPQFITNVRIYRTKVGTTSPYYLVAEVAHDSADYTDSTADASLTTQGIHFNEKVMTGSHWDNSWELYDPYWIANTAFSGLGALFNGCFFKADDSLSNMKIGTEAYETNVPINLASGSCMFTGCVFYDVLTQITGMGHWVFLGNFFYGVDDDNKLPFIRPAFPVYDASNYYDESMYLVVKGNQCLAAALDGGTYTEAEARRRPILFTNNTGMMFSKRGTGATDYQTYYQCSADNVIDIEQDNVYNNTFGRRCFQSLKMHPDKGVNMYTTHFSNYIQSGPLKVLYLGNSMFETNQLGIKVYRMISFDGTLLAASALNNSIYVETADGKLYFKDSGGVARALY